MERFRYVGYDAGNNQKAGIHETSSQNAAIHELGRRGIVLISISKDGERQSGKETRIHFTRMIAVFGEWARLLEYGLNIDEALEITLQSSKDARLSLGLRQIRDLVREGVPLNTALEDRVSGMPLYIPAGIHAALQSGSLPVFLTRLVKRLDGQKKLKSQIVSSTIYPLFLLASCSVVLLILIYAIIPAIETFVSMGSGETTLLFSIAAFVRTWLPFAATGGTAFVFATWWASRRPAWRYQLHQSLLGIPWLGHHIATYHIAGFCRSLASQLQGGVRLVPAVRMSAETIGSLPIKNNAHGLAERLGEGADLLQMFRSAFPHTLQLSHFVAIGQQTGRLGEMLDCAGDFYESELENASRRASLLITPVATIVSGIVVGAVVLSLMDALSKLNTLAIQ